MKFFRSHIIGLLIIISVQQVLAQPGNCVLRDTLFRIDFGNAQTRQEFSLGSLRNYKRAYSSCPDDGFYSYSSQTANCFNDDWITLKEDHTPWDNNGKMFLVNAASSASAFFLISLDGFKKNTRYEFAVWMLNLVKVNRPCPPLPPNIQITLLTPAGKKLASFKTGQVVSSANPSWRKYFAFFTTPDDGQKLILKMENLSDGGCGNDFAMDDITFRECYPELPPVVKAEKKVEEKPVPKKLIVPETPVVKEREPVQLKKSTVEVKQIPVEEKKQVIKVPTRNISSDIPLPQVILTRENPVIKTIETEPAAITIELYDNGQIDGDTVSIYHNNKLVVSKAGLSEKPVTLQVRVDAANPHHELTMVAENLGSIPPNTSLMVITAGKKRYEVFISSSEQKNARLVINLKDQAAVK